MSVIEPAVFEREAPIVLVPKQGGNWRFCVDYHNQSDMSKRQVYPLFRFED